ncbi:hypothetical protein HA466_0069050 [Hirschfeldia incana]|nr:hypothetical protein HA466_0069050 [Hirschfeldia incana]
MSEVRWIVDILPGLLLIGQHPVFFCFHWRHCRISSIHQQQELRISKVTHSYPNQDNDLSTWEAMAGLTYLDNEFAS